MGQPLSSGNQKGKKNVLAAWEKGHVLLHGERILSSTLPVVVRGEKQVILKTRAWGVFNKIAIIWS